MVDNLVVPPNVSAIAVQFLRAQPELAGLDDQVGTVVPADPALPFVRVVQWGQRRTGLDGTAWLTVHELQVDVWAATKETAYQVAATAWAAFVNRFPGVHDYGSVTGVVTTVDVSGLRDMPDASYTPARPRWLFSVSAWVHPLPDAGNGNETGE